MPYVKPETIDIRVKKVQELLPGYRIQGVNNNIYRVENEEDSFRIDLSTISPRNIKHLLSLVVVNSSIT